MALCCHRDLETTAFELSNGWHTEFTETPKWNNVNALISCHSCLGRDEDGGIKLISVTIMCLRQKWCSYYKRHIDGKY